MPTQQLIVAVSSTARDLPEHRQQVLDACLQQGMFPKMMEHLPASPEDAISASLELVDAADIYVGVFAYRYGYIPAGHDLSITEIEYNRAAERGIPRLIFLMHEDHVIKPGDVERGPSAARLDALKERLKTEQVVNFFRSPDDLRALVVNSLSKFSRQEAHTTVAYDVAIVEMISPSSQGVGAIMNKLEPFPGFPYFSRESDHPSQWPPRVFRDRSAFAQQIRKLLAAPDTAAELARWQASHPAQVTVVGRRTTGDDAVHRYAALRLLLSEHKDDYARIQHVVGPQAATALERLDAARRSIEEDLPNRLLILRVVNQSARDVEEFTVEVHLSGSIYDVTLNALGERAQSLEWTPNRFWVEVPLLRPSYRAELHVWYSTLPLSARVFPSPMDVRWEQTAGIVIENIVASDVTPVRQDDLLDDLAAYHRFPVDPVRSSPTFGRVQEEAEARDRDDQAEEAEEAAVQAPFAAPAYPGPYAILFAVDLHRQFQQKADAYEAQGILANGLRLAETGIVDGLARAQGAWLYEFKTPVEPLYSAFGGAYSVAAKWLGILRADDGLDLAPFVALWKLSGGATQLDVLPWNDASYEVVLQFFTDPQDSRGDSKRLITKRLPLEQIFDGEAARAGHRNSISPDFAQLMQYARKSLIARFGQHFTLEQATDSTAPFYLTVRGPNVSENFYLPKAWMRVAEENGPQVLSSKELRARLSRLYDYADSSRELTLQEFGQTFEA